MTPVTAIIGKVGISKGIPLISSHLICLHWVSAAAGAMGRNASRIPLQIQCDNVTIKSYKQ